MKRFKECALALSLDRDHNQIHFGIVKESKPIFVAFYETFENTEYLFCVIPVLIGWGPVSRKTVTRMALCLFLDKHVKEP